MIDEYDSNARDEINPLLQSFNQFSGMMNI